MNPENFIQSYESALAAQDWKLVEVLVSEMVCVTFSNGSTHIGKENVRKAFEKNFSMIKNEKYSMQNIHWVRKDDKFAVYMFEYSWTGIVKEVSVSGAGVGTSVLIYEGSNWKLLTEHLGARTS